jgi:hypothetical protein
VASAPSDTLAGWGAPVVSGEDLGTSKTFDLNKSGGAVLIWITRVPSEGRLDISEIRVG